MFGQTRKVASAERVYFPDVIEGATTSANTTTPHFSQPGSDLRMDCGDACSLGLLPDLNRYDDDDCFYYFQK